MLKGLFHVSGNWRESDRIVPAAVISRRFLLSNILLQFGIWVSNLSILMYVTDLTDKCDLADLTGEVSADLPVLVHPRTVRTPLAAEADDDLERLFVGRIRLRRSEGFGYGRVADDFLRDAGVVHSVAVLTAFRAHVQDSSASGSGAAGDGFLPVDGRHFHGRRSVARYLGV
jgi:hypothetical protein